jgi:hypothetical protein
VIEKKRFEASSVFSVYFVHIRIRLAKEKPLIKEIANYCIKQLRTFQFCKKKEKNLPTV